MSESTSQTWTYTEIKLGKQLTVFLAMMGYQHIVTLKPASATKPDTSAIAITECAYKILTYHGFLTFRRRNPWESIYLLSPIQGQLYLHFQHSKKFIFGVLLPPSLHRSSFSSTPFPGPNCAHVPAS